MEESVNVLAWIRHPGLMLDWMKAKMRDFYMLPARIAALKVRAQKIEVIIQDRDPVAAQRLRQAQLSLGQIQSDQTSMQGRLSSFFSRLGAIGVKLPGAGGVAGYYDPGLGIIPAIPLVLIATGGAVALGVVAIFSNYRKQVGIIDAIERGALSADEARTIGAGKPMFGLDLGAAAKPIMLVGALAALLYFAGPTLKKRLA